MKNIYDRAKFAISGENGDMTIQQVVFMGVALLVGSALFAFGGKIKTFVENAGNKVTNIDSTTTNNTDFTSW